MGYLAARVARARPALRWVFAAAGLGAALAMAQRLASVPGAAPVANALHAAVPVWAAACVWLVARAPAPVAIEQSPALDLSESTASVQAAASAVFALSHWLLSMTDQWLRAQARPTLQALV
jgi:hypothetical protein